MASVDVHPFRWDDEEPEEPVVEDDSQIGTTGRWAIYGSTLDMGLNDVTVNHTLRITGDAEIAGKTSMGEHIFAPNIHHDSFIANINVLYNGISTKNQASTLPVTIPDGFLNGQQFFVQHLWLTQLDPAIDIDITPVSGRGWSTFTLQQEGYMHLVWLSGAWEIITAAQTHA
jgi:hypothetical protein